MHNGTHTLFTPIALGLDESRLEGALRRMSEHLRKAEQVRQAYEQLLKSRIDFDLVGSWLRHPRQHYTMSNRVPHLVELLCKQMCEKHQLTMPTVTGINYKELVRLIDIPFFYIEELAQLLHAAREGFESGEYQATYYISKENRFELTEAQEAQIRENCILYTDSEEENQVYHKMQALAAAINAAAELGIGICPHEHRPSDYDKLFRFSKHKAGRYKEVMKVEFNQYYFKDRARIQERTQRLSA